MIRRHFVYLVLAEACLQDVVAELARGNVNLAAEFARVGYELLQQVVRECEGVEEEA